MWTFHVTCVGYMMAYKVGPLSLAGYMGILWALFVKTFSVHLEVFQTRQDLNRRPALLGPPWAQTEHTAECDLSCTQGDKCFLPPWT